MTDCVYDTKRRGCKKRAEGGSSLVPEGQEQSEAACHLVEGECRPRCYWSRDPGASKGRCKSFASLKHEKQNEIQRNLQQHTDIGEASCKTTTNGTCARQDLSFMPFINALGGSIAQADRNTVMRKVINFNKKRIQEPRTNIFNIPDEIKLQSCKVRVARKKKISRKGE